MRRWLELTSLYDLDHRFRLMDGFAGYRQLPTPSMPPIEDLADGPSFIRRISSTASARTPPADADLLPGRMQKPAEDYFKMFFADTALSGAIGATRCGLDYFGAGKVVFASDFPFDAEGGSYLVRETIKALDALDLTSAVRRRIDIDNISGIIHRKEAAYRTATDDFRGR